MKFDPFISQKPNKGAIPLQKKGAANNYSATPRQLKQNNSNGNGLPPAVQQKMESSFNTGFSDIKIHQNSQSAKDIGAQAYTQGNDVHFAQGKYDPQSQSGQELIGHELTHVVQQRAGNVKANTQAKGVPVNNEAHLEREADVMGAKAARGKATQMKVANGTSSKAPIQKKDVTVDSFREALDLSWFSKEGKTLKNIQQRIKDYEKKKTAYFKDAKKASKTLVSSAIKTNDIIVNLSKGSIENVKEYVKDKMCQIDQKSESKLQNSHNQNRVLVHCAMGRSRSVTMVIIYLMIKFQISWDHAFDILKVRREIIDPNDGFIQKLKDFEGKQYKDSAQELASLKSLHIEDTSDDSSSSEDAKEDSKHTFSKLPSSLESKF